MIVALMFPSNSMIVFFRRNPGYRLMKPWVMGLVFIVLMSYALAGLAASSALQSISNSAYRFQFYTLARRSATAPDRRVFVFQNSALVFGWGRLYVIQTFV